MTRPGFNRWSHPTTLHCLTTKVAELHQSIHIARSSRKSTNKEDLAIKEASNMSHQAFHKLSKGDRQGHQNILRISTHKSNRIHHCIQLQDKIYKNWINRINRSSCMTLKEESDQEACSRSRSARRQLQSSLESLRQHQKYKASIQTIYLRI